VTTGTSTNGGTTTGNRWNIDFVESGGDPPANRVIYDNGPLVNSPGTGPGGADESVLQTSLGMNTLGFGHQAASGYRVADDFTLTTSEHLQAIKFYAYQTGSTTTSTITSVNLRIWDGPPNNPASSVIYGDTTTDRMTDTTWSNIYRTIEGTPDTNRPIMVNTVSVDVTLGPGTYWLDWSTDGSLASGPWALPITIDGQTTTGNALQYTTSWSSALVDSGTGTPQGLPFVILGPGGGFLPAIYQLLLLD